MKNVSYFEEKQDFDNIERPCVEFVKQENIENYYKSETKVVSKKKFTIVVAALSCLCILLAGVAIISVGALSEAKETISRNEASLERLDSYRAAAFKYMDMAVIIAEGDSRYYHRVDCPGLGTEYSYLTYNDLQASNEGYVPCPLCFKELKGEYIEENF